MYIFLLFEAVYVSHVITLEKKGLECAVPEQPVRHGMPLQLQ
jgi:hypothetical protein